MTDVPRRTVTRRAGHGPLRLERRARPAGRGWRAAVALIAVGLTPLAGAGSASAQSPGNEELGRRVERLGAEVRVLTRRLGRTRAPIILTRRGHRFYLGGFDGLIQTFGHRDGPVTTFDQGYGPIVDMTFVRRRLFVLETFAPETPFAPDTGRIVRRNPDGSRTPIASRLNFPIGMAKSRKALYVTTVSYGQGPVDGLGRIVRIGLERGHDDHL